MVSKVRNFWLCVFSGVVATTLIIPTYNVFSVCTKSPVQCRTPEISKNSPEEKAKSPKCQNSDSLIKVFILYSIHMYLISFILLYPSLNIDYSSKSMSQLGHNVVVNDYTELLI